MNLVCWQYGMDVPAGPPAFKRGNLTSCRMCSAIFYSSVRPAPSCFCAKYGDGGSCKQHLSPPQFPRCICHASASSGIKMHLLLSCENWGPCRLYTQGRRIALSRKEDTAALSRFIAADIPPCSTRAGSRTKCAGAGCIDAFITFSQTAPSTRFPRKNRGNAPTGYDPG